MRDKLDKIRIELYGNGIFQGYVKSVSTSNQKVKSTMDKDDAKTYGSSITAGKDIEKIKRMTHGGLICNIV